MKFGMLLEQCILVMCAKFYQHWTNITPVARLFIWQCHSTWSVSAYQRTGQWLITLERYFSEGYSKLIPDMHIFKLAYLCNGKSDWNDFFTILKSLIYCYMVWYYHKIVFLRGVTDSSRLCHIYKSEIIIMKMKIMKTMIMMTKTTIIIIIIIV